MLSSFDWLRRSGSGAELLATLHCLKSKSHLFTEEEEMGPPLSGLVKPCQRCWVYPCQSFPKQNYCKTCNSILKWARNLGNASRASIVIWGFVNNLPKPLETGEGFHDSHLSGTYLHDRNHFLVTMHRRDLQPWLRVVFIYHGSDLKGLVQVFSTVGRGPKGDMGDILCRVIHQENRFPMDRFRIRFYPDPYQVFYPHIRENQGLLTFEASEFLRLLEMAAVFKSLFRPNEQALLHDVIRLKDSKEKHFYWGRLMGYLNQESRDMLSAWKVKHWPMNRIKLLFELVEYVAFTP